MTSEKFRTVLAVSIVLCLVFVGWLFVRNPADDHSLTPEIQLGFSPEHILWSPTGNLIALSEVLNVSNESEVSKIYLYDLQREELTLLVEAESIFTNLNIQYWSPDGRYLFFASSGDDRYREGIWRVDVTNPEDQALVWHAQAADLSPTGEIVLISVPDIHAHETVIKVYDPETMHILASYTLPLSLINREIDWSSDGKNLAFSYFSKDEAGENVFGATILDVTTGEMVELDTKDKGLYSLTWSPIGNFLAYHISSHPGSILAISRAVGQCELDLLSIDQGWAFNSIAWSPDGTQLAYEIGEGISFLDLEELFGEALYAPDFPCNVLGAD